MRFASDGFFQFSIRNTQFSIDFKIVSKPEEGMLCQHPKSSQSQVKVWISGVTLEFHSIFHDDKLGFCVLCFGCSLRSARVLSFGF
jgi:hypothetical protein